MHFRKIRIGIDVGGTYTKAVAIDNETHEIIASAAHKTTHTHASGVAHGVVLTFQACLKKGAIQAQEVIFVAHSTTQATNALVEGDVANVGIVGLAAGGLEGFLAKKQLRLEDITLGAGRSIKILNTFIKKKELTEEKIHEVLHSLKRQGAQVIVSSMAFGVDNNREEALIQKKAEEQGLMTTMASDISKMYGLTRRTRTAAINASILPKMLDTAVSTETSVRAAAVEVPLMIMRGDGGVMDIKEMKRRPILTMLSGPAASVMGSLMYLRASNGIYFEVGGTTTNIGVIKNGRPAIDYSVIGGHRTYVNSLDVRVLGVAGGSMVRIKDAQILDVGPRSAHIGGMDYAAFSSSDELEGAKLIFFSPKAGDPADYAALQLQDGRQLTITNTCAANALGLVEKEYFAYGNQEAARKAIAILAAHLHMEPEEAARQILHCSFSKIKPVLDDLIEKYKLEEDQMSLVGVGGGAASLIVYCAKQLNMNYRIPENAEVISSIGVALAMIRDVVERVVPNPTPEDVKRIRREAKDKAIDSGATPDSIEVHIEIEAQTSKLSAIALGSTEVRTADLLKTCDKEEARQIAVGDVHCAAESLELKAENEHFFVFASEDTKHPAFRVLDRKGFIRVQKKRGKATLIPIASYEKQLRKDWETLTVYKSDTISRPDFYLGIGGRLMDFNGMTDLESNILLMGVELEDLESTEKILLVSVANEL